MATITNGIVQEYTLLHAVGTTGSPHTSKAIRVAGARRISFAFSRANHSSGSSVFEVEVSLDGSTYVTFNKLVQNVANTNTQEITRASSVTLSSDTTELWSMDLTYDCPLYVRVKATVNTDGDATAKMVVEY